VNYNLLYISVKKFHFCPANSPTDHRKRPIPEYGQGFDNPHNTMDLSRNSQIFDDRNILRGHIALREHTDLFPGWGQRHVSPEAARWFRWWDRGLAPMDGSGRRMNATVARREPALFSVPDRGLQKQQRLQIIMDALIGKGRRFGFISLILEGIRRIGILPAIIPQQKFVKSHVEHPDH
jgi:hypothetical protein